MALLSDFPQAQAVTGSFHRLLGGVAIAALLTGCATSKHFNNALTEPAKASTKAAEVVASAANDVLRANALGLVDTPPADPTELVCATQEGLRAATSNLGQFGDALETVGKVAEKPDNVSFAGYIHQIRKNKEAIAAAGDAPEVERQLAEKSASPTTTAASCCWLRTGVQTVSCPRIARCNCTASRPRWAWCWPSATSRRHC